jgi:acyl homoserine lactone synthase
MGEKMIDAFSFETAHLLGNILPEILRLRHKIFVESQNYQVPQFNGMEYDQFDTPAAMYFVWRDFSGKARAVARLIPTTQAFMIGELWPGLVAGSELPRRSDVWEVTRLGLDPDLTADQRRQAVGELVCALGEFALRQGISSYLFVTHPRIMKSVLAGAGCTVEFLGPSTRLGDFVVVAGKANVSSRSLVNARRHHGIHSSVLRIVGAEPEAQAA